jgi:uncharacterized protein (TIGR01777 family)
MCLPAKLFVGGRLGTGEQCVPWIHLDDHVRAIVHLLENRQCEGPYNLIAPQSTTDAEFMAAVCQALRRPFWLHMPALALRIALGEMATLVLEGRASQPKRLLESGFKFKYPTIDLALRELLEDQPTIRDHQRS